LFLTMLAIGMTAVLPAIGQRIRREREIELQHRGRQYVRAIRLFYRKTGRFPVRLEELENTNKIRFLRKRYKDPMTPGGDWRVIHFGEAQLTSVNNAPLLPGASSSSGSSTTTGGVAGIGSSTSSPFSSGAGSSPFASTFSLSSQSSAGSSNQSSAGSATPSGQSGQPGTPVSQLSSSLGSGPTFGGGPIVGVASTSKKESIKELNSKNHYNDWEFVYDPRLDLSTGGAVQGIPGVTNQPNQTAPGVQASPLQPGTASPVTPGMPMQPNNPNR
jgi:type II secretory pathway pseudopilin PulG